ncbi:MAG: GNAT family N-acetyltransferase [Chloroflexota bacterium]|nr:GNAT family N-acetyltransferase [Chloroflexota bacterium]
MSDVEYRKAGPEDWSAIASLVGRPATEAGTLRHYLERTYSPWIAWVAETPASETPPAAADPPRARALSAGLPPLGGAVVAGIPRPIPVEGEATSPMPGDAPGVIGRIVFLGVNPRYRRRGIGQHLLETVTTALREQQVRRATLEVDGTEVEALALFRKAGFSTITRSLGLLLPPPAGAGLVAMPSPTGDDLRPLTIDGVSHLAGLLIQLGIERAAEPHDDLPAFTPAAVESWLQRPSTVAYAVWEAADPLTPLGIAWATLRSQDMLLRFIGVQDDARRRGIGRALIGALLMARAGDAPQPRPLRARVNDPAEEQAFFRRLGFEAEQTTYQMAREL